MRYFPVFLNLAGQQVLVVGGGRVAERKIRLLHSSGAEILIAAGQLGRGTRALLKHSNITWTAHDYRPELLPGKRLVFAATDDAILNRQVFTDAEQLGIAVNVVDDLEHCRFISPAVVDRSPIQIAISSSGSAPVLARRIRSWLEQMLPDSTAAAATAAGRLRSSLNTRWTMGQRRQFWDRLFTRRQLVQWSGQGADAIEAEMRAQVNLEDAGRQVGKVYLVGAGPGNPDLLTVRALRLLGQADVILHDQLVPEEILQLARRDADRIDVGKRAGKRSERQHNINALMHGLAADGKLVVRLKGGDPFIFGRGGEELDYLRARGIEVEVVPGISAALGCAAQAGIPLSHRDHAQVVSLVTGHSAADGGVPGWHDLAGPGRTVAVYMGLNQAAHIREQLLAAGISKHLPAALVVNGTRPDQQVFAGTVDELPQLADRAAAGAPGLLIIGAVARYAQAAAVPVERDAQLTATRARPAWRAVA